MAVAAYLLFLVSFCYAQVFEDGTSVEIPTGLSSQCAAVLNKTVSCSGLLSSVVHGHFPTQGDLNVICTTDCLISLQALREDQLEKCTASHTIITGGLTYPPTLSLDSLIFTYNYTCLRDSSGSKTSSTAFCGPMIDAWFNSSSTGYLTAAQNCSDCYLRTLQTQLNSDFGYSDELADDFASLTSSCGKSEYPTTSPSQYALPGSPSTTATAKASCMSKGVIASSCIDPSPMTDTYWSGPFTASETPRTQTAYSASYGAAPTSLPLTPGTSSNCSNYEQYLTPTRNRTINANSCYYVAHCIGISPEQFVSNNPSLEYDPSEPAACVLEEGYRYCALPGSSESAGTASSSLPSNTDVSSFPTMTQSGMASH